MENWLARTKFLMEKKNIKRSELAKKMGITVSQIGHYLNGRREPPLAKQKMIADVLGISIDELHSDFDKNSKKSYAQSSIRYIPVIDWICAGHGMVPTESLLDENTTIPVPSSKVGPNGYALVIKGDSMRSSYIGEKSFLSGEAIIVDPDRSPSAGDYVIALIEPTEVAIFRQYVEEGPNKYLKPLNIQYPIIDATEKAKIIGTVVASFNDFTDD